MPDRVRGELLIWVLPLLAVVLLCSSHTALAGVKPQISVTPKRVATVADFQPQVNEFASVLVLDAKTKKVLYAYEPDKKWPAASLTKLAGAMVFLDKRSDWNSVVAVTKKDEVGGGRLRVNNGATLTIKDLLYSSIVGSANNAATAMARLSRLGMKNFVAAMNRKVKALGCAQTVFYDASGMDERNQTSARDLVKIADAAFNIPAIRRAASTAVYTFRILNAPKKSSLHTIRNTNVLLMDTKNGLYVTGGKTGYLEEAQNNLVIKLRPGRQDVNQELLIVVFGVESRQSLFETTARLARWSWSAYDWSTPQLSLQSRAYGD